MIKALNGIRLIIIPDSVTHFRSATLFAALMVSIPTQIKSLSSAARKMGIGQKRRRAPRVASIKHLNF